MFKDFQIDGLVYQHPNFQCTDKATKKEQLELDQQECTGENIWYDQYNNPDLDQRKQISNLNLQKFDVNWDNTDLQPVFDNKKQIVKDLIEVSIDVPALEASVEMMTQNRKKYGIFQSRKDKVWDTPEIKQGFLKAYNNQLKLRIKLQIKDERLDFSFDSIHVDWKTITIKENDNAPNFWDSVGNWFLRGLTKIAMPAIIKPLINRFFRQQQQKFQSYQYKLYASNNKFIFDIETYGIAAQVLKINDKNFLDFGIHTQLKLKSKELLRKQDVIQSQNLKKSRFQKVDDPSIKTNSPLTSTTKQSPVTPPQQSPVSSPQQSQVTPPQQSPNNQAQCSNVQPNFNSGFDFNLLKNVQNEVLKPILEEIFSKQFVIEKVYDDKNRNIKLHNLQIDSLQIDWDQLYFGYFQQPDKTKHILEFKLFIKHFEGQINYEAPPAFLIGQIKSVAKLSFDNLKIGAKIKQSNSDKDKCISFNVESIELDWEKINFNPFNNRFFDFFANLGANYLETPLQWALHEYSNTYIDEFVQGLLPLKDDFKFSLPAREGNGQVDIKLKWKNSANQLLPQQSDNEFVGSYELEFEDVTNHLFYDKSYECTKIYIKCTDPAYKYLEQQKNKEYEALLNKCTNERTACFQEADKYKEKIIQLFRRQMRKGKKSSKRQLQRKNKK